MPVISLVPGSAGASPPSVVSISVGVPVFSPVPARALWLVLFSVRAWHFLQPSFPSVLWIGWFLLIYL